MAIKPFRVLFVCNSTGSKLWRILPVARYLNSTGQFDCQVIESKQLTMQMIPAADLIVLQMVFDRRLIKEIKKHKVKYIFEMDDLVTWVPDDHYAKKDVKNWDWKLNVAYAISRADGVTCTNEYLEKYYHWLRPFKKQTFVLPNFVDREFWMKSHKPNNSNQIRIGYVGGSSHVKDLELIYEPIKRILKEHSNAVLVTMGTGGYSSSDPMTEYNYGEDAFKGIPNSQRTHYLGSEMMVYPDRLNALSLDIGLAPLQKNRFTKSKTPIKWMEYALNRTPSICQYFLYKDVVKHGVNGFLAETSDDYYYYLKYLVENRKERKTMGERAHWDVLDNHVFEKHAQKWRDAYLAVLNSETVVV